MLAVVVHALAAIAVRAMLDVCPVLAVLDVLAAIDRLAPVYFRAVLAVVVVDVLAALAIFAVLDVLTVLDMLAGLAFLAVLDDARLRMAGHSATPGPGSALRRALQAAYPRPAAAGGHFRRVSCAAQVAAERH